MAVVFARQVADCFWPTGGTEHSVTDTLSGIHLFKVGSISVCSNNEEGHNLLDKKIRVLLLELLYSVLWGEKNHGISASSVVRAGNARTSA